jgi:hypothetical protein
MDIDESGDEWFKGPHIYVAEFDPDRGPFRDHVREMIATRGLSARQVEADPATRVQKFARKTKPEE